MKFTKTSYTNLRENLASFLKEVSKNNDALEIIWRNNESCVITTKQNYLNLLNRSKSYKHVQELLQKFGDTQSTPIDNVAPFQMDLFD